MHRCLTLLFALGVTSDEHLRLMRFGLSLSSGRGGAGVTTLFGRTAAFAMATFLSLLGPDLEGELLELTSDDEEPEDCPGLPMLGSAGGRLPWCSRRMYIMACTVRVLGLGQRGAGR